MRAFGLLALLLLPTAGAWAVDVEAPPDAGAGLPFAGRVCVDGPPGAAAEARVWLDNGTVSLGNGTQRPDRYALLGTLPPEGRLCRALVAQPGMDARTALHARLRSNDEAAAEVALDLRAPPEGDLRLVDAWGPPYSGVRVRNAGDAPLSLEAWALEVAGRRDTLPRGELAPGETAFVGARAPPGARHVEADLALREGDARLLRAERPVDALRLPRLRPGELADAEGARRAGRTALVAGPMPVEGALLVYATPDAGAAPVVELIEAAREEILLEGYTLTSPDVAAALARALDRGVRVRMLLEGAPAGGIPEEERAILATLAARGAAVALLASAPGFPARYATLHAKAIVVDRAAALVATENLHSSSYPADPAAAGTRGYGVVIANATFAARLADVLFADMAPWPDVQRVDLEALPPPAPAAPHASSAPGAGLRVASARANVTLVLSPDDPLALARAIDGAARSVDVELLFAQPLFGNASNPLLDALVDAARRNASVRVLLDARVDDGRNREVAARLNALAAREGLPLEARLDEPTRLLHAKMVLLDGERAYVGSMNWGRASAWENREAGVLLDHPEAAAWLALRFEEDWREGEDAPPAKREVGTGPAALGALLSALLRRRARRPGRRGRA